jgi:hypothetical protein
MTSLESPIWFQFRVIGLLRPSSLTVELVPPQPPDGSVLLLNLFIDEIPLHLVSPQLRMPNSMLWAKVEDRSVTAVEPSPPAGEDRHYYPSSQPLRGV